MCDPDLGHSCRGRRIHTSGHSDFGIFTNFGATSNLLILHRLLFLHNLVALHWHSLLLRPSFVMQTSLVLWIPRMHLSHLQLLTPRSTIRPLYFWVPWLQLGIFEMSINVAKWTFLFSVSASRITSFLLFSLSNCHIRKFHRVEHWNKFMHRIVMSERIEPFLRDVIVTIFRKGRLKALLCGIVSSHNTGILGFLVWVSVTTSYSFP